MFGRAFCLWSLKEIVEKDVKPYNEEHLIVNYDNL